MSLTYYLPEILFGCLAIVAILWGIMFIWSIFLSSKGKCSCRHCKGIASKTSEPPYLFLLPISFGTKYEDSEHYLASHIQPISDKSQIPSGTSLLLPKMQSKAGRNYRFSSSSRRRNCGEHLYI